MTGVDFDEVESRGLAPSGGGREVTHDLGNFVDAEGLEDRLLARIQHRSGHRRHTRGRELFAVAGLRAAVIELDAELCVVAMHGIDELPERRDVPVVVDRKRHLARNRGRHDGGGTDRHQARSRLGALDVVGDHFGRRLGITVEHHAGGHAGHHDPVGDVHPANADRREEL